MISFNDPLTSSELLVLAPVRLPSFRRDRYQGDNGRVVLKVFAEEDRRIVRSVYAALTALFELLRPHHETHSDCRQDLQDFCRTLEFHDLVEESCRLGKATLISEPDEGIRRVLHDLLGGALQALSLRLQLFALAPGEVRGIRNIFFLVRDHLKIMRNCIEDLDPARFEIDLRHCPHDTQLLVEKWSHADFHAAAKPVRVELTCHHRGTLCESCLELSTVDRIVYNLMNNAAQYTADGLVHFYILPVSDHGHDNVRFVIVNRMTEEQRQMLFDTFGDDLSRIFEGGPATSRQGARICADFCAHAYGIYDFEKARAAGYFGARRIGDHFAAWFHWPMAAQQKA